MSKIEVNTVDVACGSTLTLGSSGKTVTIASGASTSGMGRSGTVDWQTSIKTATFTAESGKGYFCNTSGGSFTVNLPSSPSVGDIVAIKDYGISFNTNALTIGRGGSNMNGSASDSIRNTNNESLTMVYADATKGWLSVEEGTGFIGESYITATGGTITTSGNCKIHTFTSPGTFCVSSIGTTSANNAVAYVVVAGAGGGGPVRGGGGGAGGYREGRTNPVTPYTASPLATTGLTITQTAYPITVGAGGSGGSSGGSGNPTACAAKGSNSIFSSITSAGGGYGTTPTPSPNAASPGGSGGGGNHNTSSGTSNGGTGNVPPVSPPQGNPGGIGYGAPGYGAGGGGGATAAGGNGNTGGCAGDGGAGATSSITGSPVARAGGGGGASYCQPAPKMGDGGAGGGGNAGGPGESGGVAGTTNTGGGGGAGWHPGPASEETGGAGGSGIVIIRYKFQ